MIPATTRPTSARDYELTIRRTAGRVPVVELRLETAEDPSKLAAALRELVEQVEPAPAPEPVRSRYYIATDRDNHLWILDREDHTRGLFPCTRAHADRQLAAVRLGDLELDSNPGFEHYAPLTEVPE
jgi:hypothetical protein